MLPLFENNFVYQKFRNNAICESKIIEVNSSYPQKLKNGSNVNI